MIFAAASQFHIYLLSLTSLLNVKALLVGLLRNCEIFANLRLQLYRAEDGAGGAWPRLGPGEAAYCWPPPQPRQCRQVPHRPAPPRPANCFLTSVLSLTFWWLCCCAAALLRGCSVHTCNLVRGISAQPSCQVPSPGSGSGRGRGGSGSRLSGCIQSDPDQTGCCNKYSRPTWHRAATHLPATGWGRGNIKSMKAVYK